MKNDLTSGKRRERSEHALVHTESKPTASLRFDRAMFDQIEALAKRNGFSFAGQVRELCRIALGNVTEEIEFGCGE